jgi:hypothetical protein
VLASGSPRGRGEIFVPSHGNVGGDGPTGIICEHESGSSGRGWYSSPVFLAMDEKSSDVLNAVLVWTCTLDLLASEAFKRGTLARDP